jgi:hypothetical protein
MRMWELRRNGVASEPIPEVELEAMLEAGTVEGSLAVRPVGKEAWKPAFRHAPFAAAASRAHRAGSTLLSAKEPPALPAKDPLRWDQQTQLHMPAQPLPAPTSATSATSGTSATGSTPPPLPQAAALTPPPPPPLEETPIPVVTGPVMTVPSMPVVTLPKTSAHAPPHAPPASPPIARPAPGFMSALVDTSFTTFVAPRVAKVFYVLFMIWVSVGMLAGLITGIVTLAGSGGIQSDEARILALLQLLATPIVSLVVLVVGRMMFESLIVFFRVAEHLAEIDRKTPG